MAGEAISGTIKNKGNIDDIVVFGPQVAHEAERLKELSFLSLLAWIACRRASGVLRIAEPDQAAFTLTVNAGQLVGVDREGAPFLEQALKELVASEDLSAARAAAAVELAAAQGKSLLQVLLEQRSCKPRALVTALRATKQTFLDALMEMAAAGYSWAEAQPGIAASDPVPTELVTYLLDHVRETVHQTYWTKLQPHLSPYMGRYPVQSELMTPEILDANMSDRETKVLENLVDGSFSLRDLFSRSLLSRNETARFFVSCSFPGIIQYRGSSIPKKGEKTLEEKLEAEIERLAKVDLFTRLDAHWSNHENRLADLYQKMKIRWGPAAKVREHSAQANDLCDAILDMMAEAYETVSDKQRRKAYRHGLLGPEKLAFGADVLFKQANLAILRHDHKEARRIIESAIDCNPRQEYTDFLRKLGR